MSIIAVLLQFQFYETGSIGSRISKSFCVSNAMKKDLYRRFGAVSKVLYDKPNERFGPISTEEAHKLFSRLALKYPEFSECEPISMNCDKTAFTCLNDGVYSWLEERPALLISSTSWTEDEDFGILLKALEDYDIEASQNTNHNLPKLICVITGKGPQKEYYCSRIASQVFR